MPWVRPDRLGIRFCRRALRACFCCALLLLIQEVHADVPGALKALASGNYEAAAEQLLPLAESGNPAAQVALGQVLRAQANPKRSAEEAARWFSRAAEQGHPAGQFWLGLMHRLGEGVPRDPEQAVRLWRSAAEAGSSQAQGMLAQALLNGDGVSKDADEAVRWARKGAESGNALAQSALAQAHLKGEGGAQRSLAEFLRWTRRAASQGYRPAMEALAVSYHLGGGVAQDYVQAHMWANLAAARGSSRAQKLREELAAKMTPEQVAEAQKLAGRWRPTLAKAQAQPGAPASPESGEKRRAGTGSGFIVGLPGYVLTNNHVVNQCSEIRAPAHKAVLRIVARDEFLDLALLEGEIAVSETARLRVPAPPRLGEPVMVAGYPLTDLLAASLNVTTGSVSALAGPKNNSSIFQITAPIQRGSSGGPVLDANGEVIGVVVSKLNALRVAMATGDVPQNVNFAISGAVVRSFLEANGIDQPDDATSNAARTTPDAAERARHFTLLLECWR